MRTKKDKHYEDEASDGLGPSSQHNLPDAFLRDQRWLLLLYGRHSDAAFGKQRTSPIEDEAEWSQRDVTSVCDKHETQREVASLDCDVFQMAYEVPQVPRDDLLL